MTDAPAIRSHPGDGRAERPGPGAQARLLLRSVLVLLRRDGRSAALQADIDPAEPLLAGHYPARPILPGVCLIECCGRGLRLAAPETFGNAVPVVVEAGQFRRPVVPGDRLTIDLSWQLEAHEWCVVARFSTDAGHVARLRSRYRTAGE